MKLCSICQRCYEDTDEACAQPTHGALVTMRPGTRLIEDKYRLDTLRARGGMGAVYAGTHVELDRPIAIKLLLPNFNADGQAVERFRREARAAARVKHPNIVDIYDYGVLADGEAYIVMELVEGETLQEQLRRRGQLPIAEAVVIARQIAEGMEAAHRNGIVHRDLKPSNIILTEEFDGSPRVKIVDFGIAKISAQLDMGDTTLTATGTLVGTPRYMSPEQCAGGEVDARSDIYSLGIIFYEMLAGRPPFEDDSAVALAVKHINELPTPLATHRHNVPPALAELVAESLATDPAQRPQTALAFARRLPRIEASSLYAMRDQAALAPARESVFEPTAALTLDPALADADSRRLGNIVVPIPEATQVRRSQPSYLYASLALALIAGAFILWSLTRHPLAEPLAQTALATPTPAVPRAVPQPSPAPTAKAKVMAKEEKPPEEAQKANEQTQTATVDPAAAEEVENEVEAKAEVSGALKEWIAATKNRDISKQMNLYNPNLAPHYQKRDAATAEPSDQEDKPELRAGVPQIKLSRDARTATTRVRKRSTVDGEEAEIIQELRWVKTDAGWKIISQRELRVLR